MALKLANNARSTLAAAISAGATSLTLTTGGGSAFPTLGTNDYTIATIISAANPNIVEIIKVTAISGDVFTIVRGQDGTTALNWNANDLVQTRPTGGAVTSRQPAISINAGNPNTHVAGDLNDLVWDSTDLQMWICTTAGIASAAVWTYLATYALTTRQPNIKTYAGNPNTHVAGNGSPTQDLCWDTTDQVMWICTTSGSAANAVWTAIGAKTVGGNILDNGSGVATGSAAVPSGITGISGILTILLSTEDEILSSVVVNAPTTVHIGTAYPNAKIAILTIAIQGMASSSGGSARLFVDRTAASTITQLVVQLRPGTDTTNIHYAVAQIMVPLTTGTNPSFSYYINEAGMTSVSGTINLDGFIQ